MKKIIVIAGASLTTLAISWAFIWWMPGHEKICPALPPHSFYSFALVESEARIPCLQAEIEGTRFLAKLDMGYDGVLSIPKHLLERIEHKCDAGTVFCGSIRGNKYEIPVFTIPRLHIGDLSFVNLPVEESHPEFERDTSLGPETDFEISNMMPRIGWRTFVGAVVLIDLQKSIAICCDSLETLKEEGYSVEQFVSTNFLPCRGLMEFEADIDNRRVKCLLDTGCTVNLIHIHPTEQDAVDGKFEFANIDLDHPLPPASLSVDGQYLGSCVFHETLLPFGVEAILGVDFFKTQVVCIDLINRKLYLYPIQKGANED